MNNRRNILRMFAIAPFAYLPIPGKIMAENITASRRLKIDEKLLEDLLKKEIYEREQEYSLENMPEGSFAKFNKIKEDDLEWIILYVMLKKGEEDGKDFEFIYRSTKLDETRTYFETFVSFDEWITHNAMEHTGMNILTYYDNLLTSLSDKKLDEGFYSVFYSAEGRSATFSASLINENELKKLKAARGIGIVTVDDSLNPITINEIEDKPFKIGYIRICADLSNITQAVDIYADPFCKKLVCSAKKAS